MRLCVLTAFWQRPEVSHVYWAGIMRGSGVLRSEGIELFVSCAVSPGDRENEVIARSHVLSRTVSEVPNQPIAAKFNAMSLGAWRLSPDYCVLVDSDGLLSDGLWRSLASRMRAGLDYSGQLDFHAYHLATKRLGYWPGYAKDNKYGRHGEPIGVGRLWSRKVLEALGWRLWPDSNRPSGHDGLSHQRVLGAGFQCRAWYQLELGGHALQLKSNVNMWSYDRLPLDPADPKVLVDFPELDLPP